MNLGDRWLSLELVREPRLGPVEITEEPIVIGLFWVASAHHTWFEMREDLVVSFPSLSWLPTFEDAAVSLSFLESPLFLGPLSRHTVSHSSAFSSTKRG